jgi:hypothetical protein
MMSLADVEDRLVHDVQPAFVHQAPQLAAAGAGVGGDNVALTMNVHGLLAF